MRIASILAPPQQSGDQPIASPSSSTSPSSSIQINASTNPSNTNNPHLATNRFNLPPISSFHHPHSQSQHAPYPRFPPGPPMNWPNHSLSLPSPHSIPPIPNPTLPPTNDHSKDDQQAAQILSNLPKAPSQSPPLSHHPTPPPLLHPLASTSTNSPRPLTPQIEQGKSTNEAKDKGKEGEATKEKKEKKPAKVKDNVCTSCGTTTTPLWRRDEHGQTICNACGQSHTNSLTNTFLRSLC